MCENAPDWNNQKLGKCTWPQRGRTYDWSRVSTEEQAREIGHRASWFKMTSRTCKSSRLTSSTQTKTAIDCRVVDAISWQQTKISVQALPIEPNCTSPLNLLVTKCSSWEMPVLKAHLPHIVKEMSKCIWLTHLHKFSFSWTAVYLADTKAAHVLLHTVMCVLHWKKAEHVPTWIVRCTSFLRLENRLLLLDSLLLCPFGSHCKLTGQLWLMVRPKHSLTP